MKTLIYTLLRGAGMKKFEYEKEYIRWKNDQIRLRRRYRDTPAGFVDQDAEREMIEELKEAIERYKISHTYEILSEYRPGDEIFVGREKYLALMEKKMAEGEGLIILYGIGGIGKSALAREYIRRHKAEYDHILLLAYEDNLRKTICNDEHLHISNLYYSQTKYTGMRNYYKEKISVLSQIAENKRLLILIDNMNTMTDRDRKAFFTLPCDILVTTRLCPSVWGDFDGILVEGMEPGQEYDSFIRAYQAENAMTEEAYEDLVFYSGLIQGHALEMMFKIQGLTGNMQGEAGDAEEKFQQYLFERFPLKNGEKQILRELSVMPAQGIAEEFYLKISGASEENLDRLTGYLLVDRIWQEKEEKEILSLHPVVAEAARNVFAPDIVSCRRILWGIYDQICDAWQKPFEQNRKIEPYVLNLLQMFPEPVGWMMRPLESMITFLRIQGQYDTALEYALKLMKSVEEYYGNSHQNSGEMALAVAEVYYSMGDFSHAEKWNYRGYKILEDCNPVNAEFYHIFARACGNMSEICRSKGEFENAVRFAEEAYRNELMSEERD